jgi:hypothetical protein
MARACGIRIGPRRFELVVLDGSARKQKIVAYAAGELPSDVEGSTAGAVAALREAAKKHNVPRDNVGLAIDTGLAAFRTVRVPFAERAKIEQVIKFEVESKLSQWNIDDVIVDFLQLESARDSSELLVTAVPKADLRRAIQICDKAGVEPLECELETTAMVNAACAANVCRIDSAEVLVHVGELSTSVVVMDGGKVREMRAIHIGALSHVPHAEEADADEEGAADEAAGEPQADGSDPLGVLDEAAVAVMDPLDLQLRLDQSIKRIRRELGRTISAARTLNPIEAIHVCGLELPDLVGSTVLEVPVVLLDVFQEDSGQPVEGYGPLVVAYGVALRQLGGGVLQPSLRREDLAYTGKLEKVELPLAVVCLLIVTLLGVWNIFSYREWQVLDSKMRTWRENTVSYTFGSMKSAGYLEFPPEDIKAYASNLDADTERTTFEQIARLRFMLNRDIEKLEKELGKGSDISQPQSALRGLAAVLSVFERNAATIGRPSFRKLTATYQPARGASKTESVRVTLNLTFFAESSLEATQNYENGFIRDIESQPWTVEVKRPQSETLENGQGIYLEGLSVVVDVSKIEATEG